MVVPLLDELASQLPGFCDARAFEWCRQVASRVPLGARSHYLECRLGTSDRIDFMSCYDRRDVNDDYRSRLGAAGARSEVWAANLQLMDQWRQPGARLSAAPYLWFEYDAPQSAGVAQLEASPSVALEADYYRRHQTALRGLGPDARGLISETMKTLLPAAKETAARRAVFECLEALPPSGSVGYISVMSARQPVTTKLFLILPRAEVAPFLRRAQWPGHTAEIESAMDRLYAREVQTAYLDLTVSDRIEERVGIATSQFQQREVRAQASSGDWFQLPPALRAEAHELERWPGVHLSLAGEVATWVVRWVDIKLVLNGTEVEYKAYLGFMPHLPSG